jgi:hypothetical protein
MTDEDQGTGPAHHPGTRGGEEVKGDEGSEAGREDTGSSHADRPTGTSSPRDATSINPDAEKPIDPASPVMPPP